ncbi:MAG: ABC transporter ATP-binding protein [Clostridia bacterium]
MKAIEISNLTKYYGKARGIIDVSFDVEEGEIFGFIGPNGAGKSTTIRTLMSLIYPDSGTAKIFGKDCIKDGVEVRKGIGYLPSEVFYYDNMKVLNLLKYSASFYGKVDMTRIKYLAEVMDLDLSKKIDDLSYGNKKKVGIVQGLLHNPKLIILDEPTGGIDPLIQQRFFDLILEENKKGATVLFSSHILSEVQRLCTRVGIIKDGKMIKVENIEVLQNTNYKKYKITMREDLPKDFFGITGVSNYAEDHKEASFIFSGDPNIMLEKLYHQKVQNLTIEEPSLEEIFMHYYEK